MKIVFGIPGKSFSGNFLKCWTKLLSECLQNGIEVILSQKYNSNVYFVRSQILGADILRGKNQKPFDGKIPYDYIMWIDSDQIFEPKHFFKLLSHQKDIVGGLYFMEGGKQFPILQMWDEKYIKKNGTFKFLDPTEIKNDDLIDVVYTGMGFLLVKYGVFESINYPWFEPQKIKIDENIIDFTSEDVSFCLKAKKNGYSILIDPTVVIGHEKSNII